MWLSFLLVSVAAAGQIGEIDTIGGTTYDCSVICAGMQRMIYYDPGYGVHVMWSWSVNTSGTTFDDRNVRYNFRDENTGFWNWIDPDFMQSGMNIFGHRVGYGAMDVDPVRHVATVSAHYAGGGGVCPILARDSGPGQGAFERSDGEPVMGVCQWPWQATSATGTIHVLTMTAGYVLAYSRMADWPTWGPPVTPIDPSPGFPCHLITASKHSTKVTALWGISTDEPMDAYMLESTDDGETWQGPEQFLPPDAYQGDTVSSFHISSFGATFDRDDNLSIAAAVMPVVHDTGYITPAEIWHYNAANNPAWNRIHRAGCDPANLAGRLDYTSLYACRPKIGQDPETGRLCVIWSQYDSANLETATGTLRADVWCSTSPDGGYTWSPAVNLTGPDSCTRVYCDIAPVVNDTMHVAYISDRQAGEFVQGQGQGTYNPVIYQKVPVTAVAVNEPKPARRLAERMQVWPSPTRDAVYLRGAKAAALRDCAGRTVAVLHPGRNSLGWLAPGVYFAGERVTGQSERRTTAKVVIRR